MRGQAVGFLGEEPVRTPRLDAFAEESIVLPQTVVNYPICSPSRAMLLTGQYPHANGVLENCNSRSAPYGHELSTGARCWSDVLADRGYDLGYIGKWHLDSPRPPYVESPNNTDQMAWNEWTPPHRRHGFDYWYAYGTMDRHDNPMYWDAEAPRDGAHRHSGWGPIHEADLAVRYIRNQGGALRDPDRPFALMVSMNPPHMPYELVPGEYVERYTDLTLDDLTRRPNIPPSGTRWGDYYRQHVRNYYAMITGVDQQFGRILDALQRAGLADETLVLFTSDHGNCLGIHDQISKNNPYAESVRVPFLLRWPGRLEPRHDDLLLSTPDICPTLLDLMGLAEEIPDGVQGTSHAALLRGAGGPRPTAQLYLKTPLGQPDWGHRGVRTHTHTLVVELVPNRSPSVTLFHDAEDPHQLVDVAAEQPEVVDRLIEEELLPLLRRTGDPGANTWDTVAGVTGDSPGVRA
jgi:arylsulfatase A-like enzyme